MEAEMDGVRILQNPGMISIVFETSPAQSFIQITDVEGRTIRSENANSSTIQISTEEWAAGVYFIRLQNEQVSRTLKKIMIQ